MKRTVISPLALAMGLTLLAPSAEAQTDGRRQQSEARKPANRRIVINLDANGREIGRDTVEVDPREEAGRLLAEEARALAESNRAQAEQYRRQANAIRQKADSLRRSSRWESDEPRSEELEALAERVNAELERAHAALERHHFDLEMRMPELDHGMHLWVPRSPRPPRAAIAPRAPYGSRKRLWIQAGPETDVDEKDLSNDSMEVRQYTLKRRKGSKDKWEWDSFDRPMVFRFEDGPTPPHAPKPRSIARLEISPDAKSATVYVKLGGGRHDIRLTDASGATLLTETVNGTGNFERSVKLTTSVKKPLRLEVKRQEGGNNVSVVITED